MVENFLSESFREIDECIELYQICEKGLEKLPKPDLDVISSIGNFKIIQTDLTLKKNVLEQNENLRSAIYTYNLLAWDGGRRIEQNLSICLMIGAVIAFIF